MAKECYGFISGHFGGEDEGQPRHIAAVLAPGLKIPVSIVEYTRTIARATEWRMKQQIWVTVRAARGREPSKESEVGTAGILCFLSASCCPFFPFPDSSLQNTPTTNVGRCESRITVRPWDSAKQGFRLNLDLGNRNSPWIHPTFHKHKQN